MQDKQRYKKEVLMYNEKDNIIVCWPESQDYMKHPHFKEAAELLNTEEEINTYGPSAYKIPNYIIEDIDYINRYMYDHTNEVDRILYDIAKYEIGISIF